MDGAENDVKKTLKKHLKGATASTIETLAKRIGVLPGERVLLTTDIGIALAATSLRAAVEFLRAAPEVSQLIPAHETRVWGEIGRRLSATSADTAADFFQSSAKVLNSIAPELRSPVLRLVSKQAALSANTAVDCFKSTPAVIGSIGGFGQANAILDICLELARHSVKHSCDLFRTSPSVLSQLTTLSGGASVDLISRSLQLTSAFAMKSGGTAAEFFAELPLAARLAATSPGALQQLFANTEGYLERSGGVALQYYKAASRVLAIGGEQAFDRWSQLAARVSLQGNAASYHFMKASPQILSDLAVRSGERRQQVIAAVLEIVDEIGNHNSAAAVECFKASPIALGAASLGQFREWAMRGIETPADDIRKLQAYYALESRGSQEALFRIEGGLTLDAVSQTLRFYVEGLTGHPLNIAPLSAIPEEVEIGDGKTIRLPSVVAEFETEPENFRLFKVIAAHAAGQVEFGTYDRNTPEIAAARSKIRADFGLAPVPAEPPSQASAKRSRSKRQQPADVPPLDFTAVLEDFPDVEFATRLFTTIENGRIDFMLRRAYKGIRRDLDAVRSRLLERRPRLDRIPMELVPFELLFQIAVCGGVSEEAMLHYPTLACELSETMARYVQRDSATVADSLMAARRIYSLFVQQSSEAAGNSDRKRSSEDGDGAGEEGSDAESLAGESDEGPKSVEMQDDPFSFWSQNLVNETSPDYDQFSRTNAESLEQDLEKGDRPFYYDEWDRELGDYRTRWCRIIERQGVRGARSFVELVRSRYSGVISSIRYQFQLLRPENLRRIRGEIDGEDYDLQAVIDYALDKRASGRIDDRLYTRKLRRERDVAVSFLLDMSSSTARTISRDPRKPYTQPGQRIIDIEKEGLILMSEALEAVGDAYSMQGFTSEGRRNVKFYVIKDFAEGYSSEIERRIGGITYQNNTRLGAAIRHATTRLSAQEARTKLLIVLSDGRPYDHDYGDSRYAREDTRMALRQSRLAGITPFCITIDRESEDLLRDMYGEIGYTIIDDVLSLPERLPGIYSRLTT
jgi:hypothetical protein